MKNKIQTLNRISKSKFTKSELQEIYNRTNYLESTVVLSERCYNIVHDLYKVVFCKECKIKRTNFLRISTGYRDFCSCTCKNIFINRITDIKERTSKSSTKSYYKFTKSELKEQQNKRLQTMVNKGIITNPKDRLDFYQYLRLVWRITNFQNIQDLKHFEKRGRNDVPGSFQLDHKYSISKGFIENILPIYIGNINNLEMIPSNENSSKKQKCSISLEELYVRN